MSQSPVSNLTLLQQHGMDISQILKTISPLVAFAHAITFPFFVFVFEMEALKGEYLVEIVIVEAVHK